MSEKTVEKANKILDRIRSVKLMENGKSNALDLLASIRYSTEIKPGHEHVKDSFDQLKESIEDCFDALEIHVPSQAPPYFHSLKAFQELHMFHVAAVSLSHIRNDYRSQYHTHYFNELKMRVHELVEALSLDPNDWKIAD